MPCPNLSSLPQPATQVGLVMKSSGSCNYAVCLDEKAEIAKTAQVNSRGVFRQTFTLIFQADTFYGKSERFSLLLGREQTKEDYGKSVGSILRGP